MPDTTDPHVYVVREIRDGVSRRTHGYFASLQGAFAYAEAEERKKPLVDSVRFELFAAPGEQWLIHEFHGPGDDWPEISDLVISRHEVIPDRPAAAPSVPADRAGLLDAAAQAIRDSNGSPEALEWWRTHPQLIPAHVYAAAVLSVLPPAADRAAAERLSRVLEWVTGEVVSAKTEFGDGYRAAQRDIRDLIKGRFDYDPRPATPPAVVAEPGKENGP